MVHVTWIIQTCCYSKPIYICGLKIPLFPESGHMKVYMYAVIYTKNNLCESKFGNRCGFCPSKIVMFGVIIQVIQGKDGSRRIRIMRNFILRDKVVIFGLVVSVCVSLISLNMRKERYLSILLKISRSVSLPLFSKCAKSKYRQNERTVPEHPKRKSLKSFKVFPQG